MGEIRGVVANESEKKFRRLAMKKFGYGKGDYPVAERYYDRAITLPIFPKMSNRDADDVIKAVKKVILNYRA